MATSTKTQTTTNRKPGGYGPRWTEDQLTTAFIARSRCGSTWKAAAAVAGIKSPGYLARTGKSVGIA